jgi:hypothetical protein
MARAATRDPERLRGRASPLPSACRRCPPPFPVRAVRREVLCHRIGRHRPGVLTVRRALEAMFLPRDPLVLALQSRRAAMPGLVPFIDEVAVHARAATGAVRRRKGGSDSRQIDLVQALAAAGRPFLARAKKPLWLTPRTGHIRLIGVSRTAPLVQAGLRMAVCASMKAHFSRGGVARTSGVHPPHPSLAKKAAAFPRIVRCCYRTAFCRRRGFRSVCRSSGASPGSLAPRSWQSHRVSVDKPSPRSSAIFRRVRSLVCASRTYSRRNSGVGLFPFPTEYLLGPQQVIPTLSGQVQPTLTLAFAAENFHYTSARENRQTSSCAQPARKADQGSITRVPVEFALDFLAPTCLTEA